MSVFGDLHHENRLVKRPLNEDSVLADDRHHAPDRLRVGRITVASRIIRHPFRRARPYVPELPLLQSSLLRIKRDPRLVIAMPGRPGKRFAGKGEFSMAELDVHEPLLAATDTQSVVLGL